MVFFLIIKITFCLIKVIDSLSESNSLDESALQIIFYEEKSKLIKKNTCSQRISRLLDEFAIKAVTKFLKRSKGKDLPEEIFTYNHTEPELNSKRCRTSTKKINESKEQESQFSTKKQKKHKDDDEPNQEPPLAVTKNSKKNLKQNENVKDKVINPTKIKADKTKAEENVAKSQGNQMFGLSNLEVQFRDESSLHEETVLSTSEERNNLEMLPSKPASSADPNLTASSTDRSKILPSSPSLLAERSHAPSTSADRSNILPLTHSLDVNANQSAGSMLSAYAGSSLKAPLQSTSAETSLTSTWELCKSLYDVDNSEQTCSNTTLTEMNFPDVMNSMDCAPTYSALMPQKSQSLGLRRSPRKHLSSPASFTGNSTSQPYYQTSQECTSTQKPREEFSATEDLNQYQEAPIQQIQRSPFPSPSPMNSPHQPHIQSSTFSSQHSPSPMNSPHQPHIQSSTFSSQHSPSPMNSPHQPHIQSSTFSSQHSMSPMNSPHQPHIQSSPFSSQHCLSPMNSPLQHVMQSHDSDQSDDNKMVKLLQTSDIQVRRGSLRKANTNASKGAPQKTSFKLASSLLPLLFSVDELANSCGQGLKKKANDVRTPLDPVKIGVLKDYVAAWCTKHNRCMQDG
ncbi:unnamed protein product [Mytilus coruscus]|uniref:Uncharacterized protein n=1 Tax=Mytilus coruscus TaxID=42192 RepID=A0A6J8A6X4_MYTCO|nr:unnamed protein product [Mytilus coruscus]